MNEDISSYAKCHAQKTFTRTGELLSMTFRALLVIERLQGANLKF